MSYAFSAAYQDSGETHPSPHCAYEPKSKWKMAVTETNVFTAFAYTALARSFSPVNVM